MAFKNLTQWAARKLYHGTLGKALRGFSEKALSNHDDSKRHIKGCETPLSGIEKLAIKADLKFSDMAAGHSKLLESSGGLKHHARMLYSLHKDDKAAAGSRYRNLLNISLTNMEYNQICEGVVSRPPSGAYGAPDVYFATLLSSTKESLPAEVRDAHTIDRAVATMDEHMGVRHDYVGSRNLEDYMSAQRHKMRAAVKENIASHWLFNDCYEELEETVKARTAKAGSTDKHTDLLMNMRKDRAVNLIADEYMQRRAQEHRDVLQMSATNYGMGKENKYGIHITAKEIEDGFKKVIAEEMALQTDHAYNPHASSLRDKFSTLGDVMRYGSFGNATMARMNLK